MKSHQIKTNNTTEKLRINRATEVQVNGDNKRKKIMVNFRDKHTRRVQWDCVALAPEKLII